MRSTLFLCLILGMSTQSAFAQALSLQQKALFKSRPELLFLMERDLNKNIVLYNCDFFPGRLRQEKPTSVTSHWLNLKEGPKDESPILDHEQKAYGHSVENGILKLNAVPDIPMTLEYDDKLKRTVAYVSLDDRKVRLVRVYFKVKYLVFIPVGAEYFELHGYDADTKAAVKKRITPE